jgi:hypothetical protein
LLDDKPLHVYRVLFIVRKDLVHVLHVLHGDRQAMKGNDVVFPAEE